MSLKKLEEQEVKGLQKFLTEARLYEGELHGKMDSITTEAYKTYQTLKGLSELYTGMVVTAFHHLEDEVRDFINKELNRSTETPAAAPVAPATPAVDNTPAVVTPPVDNSAPVQTPAATDTAAPAQNNEGDAVDNSAPAQNSAPADNTDATPVATESAPAADAAPVVAATETPAATDTAAPASTDNSGNQAAPDAPAQ